MDHKERSKLLVNNFRLLPIASAVFALSTGTTANSDELLEEIVVTATKRASDLQSVPIAVSAITDAALRSAGAEDFRDIQRLDPNLNFVGSQSNLNTTSIRIRGVGTTGNNTGFESSVGVFIDGVYQSRPGIALSELVDIEQVEILRGPQGTLFGRNTSAGAINIKTKLAAIDDDSAFVSVSYGDFNLKNIQAGFNVPINEVSAVRFAGSIRERDGTVEAEVPTAEDHNTTDRYILRGSYVWEPTLDSQLELRADHSHTDSICCAPVILTPYDPEASPLAGFFGADTVDSDKRIAPGENSFEKSTQSGVSVSYKKQFDELDVTYVASYRDVDTDNWGDSDFTATSFIITPENNPNNIHSTTETHEFRVNGEALDGSLDWLLGAYYLKESIAEEVNRSAGTQNDDLIDQLLTLNAQPLFTNDVAGSFASNLFFQDTEGYAIFTHNILRLDDDWSVTLGLRYADERKNGGMTPIDNGDTGVCAEALGTGIGSVITIACTPIYGPVNGALISPYSATFEDDAFTYTAGLDYQGIEDTLIYASISNGFKSGGINLDISGSGSNSGIGGAGNPTFDSETIDAKEIGLKTKFLDGALSLNAALFHMDIEDLQTLQFSGTAFQVFEVPEARSQGVELDFDWLVSENIMASLGYAFVETEADLQTNDADGECSEFNFDSSKSACGSSELSNAPEHRVVLSGYINVPLEDGWVFSVAPIVRYESSSRPDPADLRVKQGSNTIVDLNTGFENFDRGFEMDFWVKNVTDEVVNTRAFSTITAALTGATSKSTWLNEPRTMGVTFTQSF